ncbi:MAG: MBL fold metallo-hydrolase [Cytophagales bacterium]|jgi:glyoxylase-like metal-dependent hydrolase (beta-lactamase superfamily II)|nr:MBL fold metallo-hydrolase [Cytophagales bacterium]MCA6388840.1 MBL fold metallo-hydrolase [Cytophagales bacterium]MCA6390725.1 MBL fold metallo-hydrolase [Cytophagales bacterium]MCA6398196.1 MBL fold metallo-hydrolase [Cytophagales bacterium]MCA6401988.1 MBL fold metallo-hydrolase [Cytophagales bacterium]
MKLHTIDTGFFKLDGGAMFGVVPKSIWNKLNPSDSNNMCNWAMRCLLIEDGNQLILIDNGLGTKQDDKFFSYYFLNGDDSLSNSLYKAGFSETDVTDMFLTHLHFDHCGGGVSRVGEKLKLTFPNAHYWSNEDHWRWATQPNAREKASFLKENILPMQESGQLKFVDEKEVSPFPQMDIFLASGHTDRMMIPKIKYKDKTICFMADLLPSSHHVPLPYVMGYDTRPLLTMQEKELFLNEAAANNYILFLEHDPIHECCTVKQTDKGVRLDRVFPLAEIN